MRAKAAPARVRRRPAARECRDRLGRLWLRSRSPLGGDDDRRRIWRETQVAAPRGVSEAVAGWTDCGDPAAARVGAHGAGTDEHDVSECTQQRHHEAIGLEEAAHLSPAVAAVAVESDDAVERRDEVADDRRTAVDERNDRSLS